MKAKKYQIENYENLLAKNHNCSKIIDEIYISDLKIVFNKESVFRSNETPPRWSRGKNIEDIEINDKFSNDLNIYLKRKQTVENKINTFFNNGNDDFENVEIELSEDEMFDLALQAHERDLTISEFVNIIFEEYIEEYENFEKPGEVRSINTTS